MLVESLGFEVLGRDPQTIRRHGKHGAMLASGDLFGRLTCNPKTTELIGSDTLNPKP